MTDLTNAEADLGSATQTVGGRAIPLLAARMLFLVLILAIWQGAVAAGVAGRGCE